MLPVFLLAEAAAEDGPLICSFPDKDFMPTLFAGKGADDRYAFWRIRMLDFFCFPVVLFTAPIGAVLLALASVEGFPALGTDLTHFFSSSFRFSFFAELQILFESFIVFVPLCIEDVDPLVFHGNEYQDIVQRCHCATAISRVYTAAHTSVSG